jgi:hypothetical protein
LPVTTICSFAWSLVIVLDVIAVSGRESVIGDVNFNIAADLGPDMHVVVAVCAGIGITNQTTGNGKFVGSSKT